MAEESAPRPQAAEQKKKMRNWWIKTVLLLALIAFSVAVMFTLGDYVTENEVRQVGFREMLEGMSVPFFFAFLGMIALYIAIEFLKFSYLLKIYTGKWRVRTAMKTMLLGKYYDGVTPFASGGQPFQIYYLLKKKDIPKGAAAAVPLARLIVSLAVWCVFSLLVMCFAPDVLASSDVPAVSATVRIVAWFSVFLNLSFPVILGVLSFFPRFVMKLTAILIFLLKKMHIVKRKYAVTKKYVRGVKEYCIAIQTVLKKWKLLFPLLLMCIAETATTASIPFFAVAAIANVPMTGELYLQVVSLNIISQFSAYLIPTPGNTGAVETTGTIVFATVLITRPGVNAVLGWVILVWRFFTFYMYILSGIGLNAFEIARSAYRNRKAKKAS